MRCYIVGSVALAGIVGIVTGSWLVFAVAGATLLGASLASATSVRTKADDGSQFATPKSQSCLVERRFC